MAYTTVTQEGLGSRLGNSIKGIVIGIILILVGCGLLFWNEGNFIQTQRALEEGAGAVISLSATTAQPENDRKLVHLTGTPTTDEILVDNLFSVSISGAAKLRRHVEMYQWQESQKSITKEKLGGGTETVTEYTYSQGWAPTLHDSSKFKNPEYQGKNPSSIPIQSETWTARRATLGDFMLSPTQIERISGEIPLPIGTESLNQFPEDWRAKAKYHAEGVYFGQDPALPQVGDIRMRYTQVPLTEISIIAQQAGNALIPYMTKAGKTIDLLSQGRVEAAAMFESAQSSNVLFTWVFRFLGTFLVVWGFKTIFAPIGILASVLPPLAFVVRIGTGLAAWLLGLPLSLIVIAIGWLYYRPIIGITLLAAAIIIPTVLYFKKKPATVQPQL